mgnify:CR=1 FL=1
MSKMGILKKLQNITKIAGVTGLLLLPMATCSYFIHYRPYKAIRPLENEMKNSAKVEYVVQDGDTYLSLMRRYFPIGDAEFSDINNANIGNVPPGGGAEDFKEHVARNLYESTIRRDNGVGFHRILWKLEPGDTIQIPKRNLENSL